MTICQSCGENVDPVRIVPRPDDPSRVVCAECADVINDALSEARDAKDNIDDANDAIADVNDALDDLSEARAVP